MKKYLILVVFSMFLSGCFICKNTKTPIQENVAESSNASDNGETKTVVVEKVVEKIVKVKEKAEPSITISAKDAPQFETASDKLTDEGKKSMKQTAKELKKTPNAMILIVGHTDNIGDDATNMVLSEARAKTVAAELKANGVENMMGIDGKGSSEPKESNDTEEGRKANRRVEIFIRK